MYSESQITVAKNQVRCYPLKQTEKKMIEKSMAESKVLSTIFETRECRVGINGVCTLSVAGLELKTTWASQICSAAWKFLVLSESLGKEENYEKDKFNPFLGQNLVTKVEVFPVF